MSAYIDIKIKEFEVDSPNLSKEKMGASTAFKLIERWCRGVKANEMED